MIIIKKKNTSRLLTLESPSTPMTNFHPSSSSYNRSSGPSLFRCMAIYWSYHLFMNDKIQSSLLSNLVHCLWCEKKCRGTRETSNLQRMRLFSHTTTKRVFLRDLLGSCTVDWIDGVHPFSILIFLHCFT